MGQSITAFNPETLLAGATPLFHTEICRKIPELPVRENLRPGNRFLRPVCDPLAIPGMLHYGRRSGLPEAGRWGLKMGTNSAAVKAALLVKIYWGRIQIVWPPPVSPVKNHVHPRRLGDPRDW